MCKVPRIRIEVDRNPTIIKLILPSSISKDSLVYCHTPCIMGSGEIATKLDKFYKVTYVSGNEFAIIDEQNRRHTFEFTDCNLWFELRIKKI